MTRRGDWRTGHFSVADPLLGEFELRRRATKKHRRHKERRRDGERGTQGEMSREWTLQRSRSFDYPFTNDGHSICLRRPRPSSSFSSSSVVLELHGSRTRTTNEQQPTVTYGNQNLFFGHSNPLGWTSLRDERNVAGAPPVCANYFDTNGRCCELLPKNPLAPAAWFFQYMRGAIAPPNCHAAVRLQRAR